MNKIELGDEAKDTVTGLVGVVVARTQWLTGCARIVLQPKCKKDNEMKPNAEFDEPQVVLVKRAKKPKEKKEDDIGGPRQMMTKNTIL